MKPNIDTEFSIIAQLVFAEDPVINLAQLVQELDTVLTRINCADRSLTWDHDDVAIFDMHGTRIILALITAPRPGVAVSLTVSVGPSALRGPAPMRVNHAALCTRLVERLQVRLRTDGIIWHDSSELVQPDMIDAITACPPVCRAKSARQHPIFASVSELTIDEILQRSNGAAPKRPLQPDNDQPDLPLRHHDAELCRLRNALYPAMAPPKQAAAPVQQQNSPQMRLAIYTMNATLIAVALPVGVAMLTHSLIKGDNLRTTTGAMVATGLGLSWMQSPSFQTLISIAG